MASKRMSISALLSSDSKPSGHSDSNYLQQSSHPSHRSYHPENEPAQDVDTFHKRSRESTSTESHFSQLYSNPTSSNTYQAWYQPPNESRTSSTTHEPRSVQRQGSNYPYPYSQPPERSHYQVEDEHTRSYYPPSPSYDSRYLERQQLMGSKPIMAQTQPSYSQHTLSQLTYHSHPSEHRERDTRQTPTTPSHTRSLSLADTGDSLLSVLTRTAASEAVSVGPGQSRNVHNPSFSSSPTLHPPPTLRRDRDKEVERDRIPADRNRDVTHPPQFPREYQRSPFHQSEPSNPPHYYHSDIPRSPEMQVLRARSETHAHPTSAPQYTPLSQSPSRSQPVHNVTNTHYHQTLPPEVQLQPSPSMQPIQHRPQIQNPGSPLSNTTSRPTAMPPRLGLTLPLSLSPATISGQLVSPISPQGHSRSSATNVGMQTQSRSTHYSHTAPPASNWSSASAQSKERMTPQASVGRPSNSTTFMSQRNQVPQAMQPHRLSISHSTSAQHITSPQPQPHSPSFVLPLRPLSPQHQQSFRRVSGPIPTPTLEPTKDIWEKDSRLSRNPSAYRTSSNVDTDPTRRNVTSKRPISYDQRRVDESRMSIAEVISEKSGPGYPTSSNVQYPQERSSIPSNDKGFRLWNNGPIIEETLPPQRKDVETPRSTVKMEAKSNEDSDAYRANRSHREESLAHFSPLPLKTLPVPNVERQRAVSSQTIPEIQEQTAPDCSTRIKDKGQYVYTDGGLTKVASPQPKSPLLHPLTNILNPEPRSLHHPDAYDRSESLARSYPQVFSPGSKEKAPVSLSPPVMQSAVIPGSPRLETKDGRPPVRVDERSRAVSPARSDHSRSHSPHLNKASRSPHLSATDTMSSAKNSEVEPHQPSPRRPQPSSLSDDAPVLYDSIQYPLPLPTGDKVSPKVTEKVLVKALVSDCSPVPIDNEQRGHPLPPPELVQPVMTPPLMSLPEASVTAMAVDVGASFKELQDAMSVDPMDSSAKDDIEMKVSANAASEVPSTFSDERHEHPAKPVMEDKHPVHSPQLERNDLANDSNERPPAEVADLSMEGANLQSSPSPTDPLTAEPSLDVSLRTAQSVEKPSLPPSVPSPSPPPPPLPPVQDPLPSATRDQSEPSRPQEPIQQSGQRSENDAEVSTYGTGLASPVPGLPQSSDESPVKEDVSVGDIKFTSPPGVEISSNILKATVSPRSATASNEGGLSDATGQPSNVASSVLEEAKNANEEISKANLMDMSVDVPVDTQQQQDDQSLEDELLSLVDDPKPDVKPKVVIEAPPSPALPSATSRNSKGMGSTAKNKSSKQRGQGKSSKSKNIRPDSETPSSPIPGNQPTSGHSSKLSNRLNKVSTASRKKTAGAGSTVRSVSVMPEPTPEPTPAPPEEKLYCVCRTLYDEDKVMIACDRCDEWYHPGCVHLPDQEIDLIDQFICEKCRRRFPGLKTTYKARCYRGTHHISDYDSSPPCWKAVRGLFSKYCSDTCGIAHMRAKIARSGKDPNELWPLVRHAKKREGVAIEYLYDGSNVTKKVKLETADDTELDERRPAKPSLNGTQTSPSKTKMRPRTNGDRMRLAALKQNLAAVRSCKDRCRLELEYVTTRRRLLDLAVERASEKFCGWDTRLEMGDHEWATWIISLEGKKALYGNQGDDDDDDDDEEEEDAEGKGTKLPWLCYGPVECPRHNGWKTVRDLELQMEVDSKNSSIKQLSETERELKGKIEELDSPPRSDKKVKKNSR